MALRIGPFRDVRQHEAGFYHPEARGRKALSPLWPFVAMKIKLRHRLADSIIGRVTTRGAFREGDMAEKLLVTIDGEEATQLATRRSIMFQSTMRLLPAG